MKKGDYIGVGVKPTEVDLICEVRAIIGDEIHLWVVNGAWEFKITSTGAYYADGYPKEKLSTVPYILYTGPIPKSCKTTREMAEWMTDRINRWWYFPRAAAGWQAVSAPILRFKLSVGAAVNEFKRVWEGLPLGKRYDIPF